MLVFKASLDTFLKVLSTFPRTFIFIRYWILDNLMFAYNCPEPHDPRHSSLGNSWVVKKSAGQRIVCACTNINISWSGSRAQIYTYYVTASNIVISLTNENILLLWRRIYLKLLLRPLGKPQKKPKNRATKKRTFFCGFPYLIDHLILVVEIFVRNSQLFFPKIILFRLPHILLRIHIL